MIRRVLCAVVVTAAFALTACGRGSSPRTSNAAAHAAAAGFLDRYVDGDGRVVRHDQGGDTVSEGQGYALLLAFRDGDRDRFQRVWTWTKTHLQRSDALFAWQWRDGHVVDDSPATDADLDIAHALVLAGAQFHQPALRTEGTRVARAILDHESIDAGGQRVLVAGPWAVAPRVVNPSYLDVCAFPLLRQATDDGRWDQAETGSRAVLAGLTDGGRLPPDWAVVDEAGHARPSGPPSDPTVGPRYGLDAMRLPARTAQCDGGRSVAAALWPRLRTLRSSGASIAYSLDGRAMEQDENAVGLVAAAAAARAARDDRAVTRLLDQAAGLERQHPTYYGGAWVALAGAPTATRTVALRAVPIAATQAADTTTTTTAPSTTTASPTSTTTSSTSTSTSSTTSTTTARSTTTSTTVRRSTTSTTRPSRTAPRSAGTGGVLPGRGPDGPRGDLSSPAAGADDLLQQQPDQAAPPRIERHRRTTAGVVGGGLALAAAAGAALGLRERAVLRRRLRTAVTGAGQTQLSRRATP